MWSESVHNDDNKDYNIDDDNDDDSYYYCSDDDDDDGGCGSNYTDIDILRNRLN